MADHDDRHRWIDTLNRLGQRVSRSDDAALLAMAGIIGATATFPLAPLLALQGAPLRALVCGTGGLALLSGVLVVQLGHHAAGRLALAIIMDLMCLGFVISDPTSPMWVGFFAIATIVGVRLTGRPAWEGRALALVSLLLGFVCALELPVRLGLPTPDPPMPDWMTAVCLGAAFLAWLLFGEVQLARIVTQTERASEAQDYLRAELAQRQKLLERLEEANRKAEAANVARSAFLANMSHEIRTPLGAVIGLIDVAMESDDPHEELALAKRSANHLLGLLNDVLDLSKIEAGAFRLDRQPTDIHALVHDVVDLTRVTAQAKGITLRLRIDLERRPVRIADGLRLKQVLHNLLSNAVKFTEYGEVRVEVVSNGDDVTFRVQDTGIGMTPEQVAEVFDPFRQAEASITRRYGGTGLGLTIVRRILELMHCELDVDSTPGVGTTMTFTARLRRGRPLREHARTLPPTRLHAESLSILIAEDNPVNQLIARRMLEARGQRVEIVENGAEAVERAAEGWDLILMDLQMPVLDGQDATRRIREEEAREGRPQVPIVALTANALHGDEQACLDAGMDGFLAKPLQAEALDRVLLRLAARAVS